LSSDLRIAEFAGPAFSEAERFMRLYIEPMDAVLVDVERDGRVRLENEDWAQPTLQERRAILYAASKEIEALTELMEILEDANTAGSGTPPAR
jgi:hypothetical protein